MKNVKTKEKITKHAKEIAQRNISLVQEIGEMKDLERISLPQELQEEYYNSKNKEKFFKDLRKTVRDEFLQLITTKRVSVITLVKGYPIFTDSELNSLFSKYSTLENVRKLIIIHEIEKLLVNTVATDDEDINVARAVAKIYKAKQ